MPNPEPQAKQEPWLVVFCALILLRTGEFSPHQTAGDSSHQRIHCQELFNIPSTNRIQITTHLSSHFSPVVPGGKDVRVCKEGHPFLQSRKDHKCLAMPLRTVMSLWHHVVQPGVSGFLIQTWPSSSSLPSRQLSVSPWAPWGALVFPENTQGPRAGTCNACPINNKADFCISHCSKF